MIVSSMIVSSRERKKREKLLLVKGYRSRRSSGKLGKRVGGGEEENGTKRLETDVAQINRNAI